MRFHWFRHHHAASGRDAAPTFLPSLPVPDVTSDRARRIRDRESRFAQMLSTRSTVDEARTAVENAIVRAVITSLEEGMMQEAELSPIGGFVLGRVDTAHSYQEFVTLLQSLTDRWPIFGGTLAVYQAIMGGASFVLTEDLITLATRCAKFFILAENGPLGPVEIDEAVGLAEAEGNMLSDLANSRFDHVMSAYRAAQRIHQAGMDRWLGNGALIDHDLCWLLGQEHQVWLEQGPVLMLRAVGVLDDAWACMQPYPGLIDGLDRRILRVLACLDAGYEQNTGLDWLAPFRARLGTAVAEAEYAAGLQLLRDAEAEGETADSPDQVPEEPEQDAE